MTRFPSSQRQRFAPRRLNSPYDFALAVKLVAAMGLVALALGNRFVHLAALAAAARRVTALVEIFPARAGRNRVLIEPLDRVGQPFQARELVLEFAHGASGVSGLRRALSTRPSGGHMLDGSELALSGRWELCFEVLVSDFELDVLSLTIDLP